MDTDGIFVLVYGQAHDASQELAESVPLVKTALKAVSGITWRVKLSS
jgi:hypothetical protein